MACGGTGQQGKTVSLLQLDGWIRLTTVCVCVCVYMRVCLCVRACVCFLPLSKVVSYGSLVETLSLVEELGDILWCVLQEVIL